MDTLLGYLIAAGLVFICFLIFGDNDGPGGIPMFIIGLFVIAFLLALQFG